MYILGRKLSITPLFAGSYVNFGQFFGFLAKICSSSRGEIYLLDKMAKICYSCAKGTMFGNTLSRRGQLKKKGGTGSKTSRVNKRTFTPNLQKIRTIIKGKVKRVLVCTKCIKAGKINKYLPPATKTS